MLHKEIKGIISHQNSENEIIKQTLNIWHKIVKYNMEGDENINLAGPRP